MVDLGGSGIRETGMLAVRHYPELVTPELMDWLSFKVRRGYDDDGLFSQWLVEDDRPLPGPLPDIAQAVCPGVDFRAVALRGYRDGSAVTPCHSDHGATGFGFILSLGATRTFRAHRVPDGVRATAECGDPNLDVLEIQCVSGTVVIMDEAFHRHHHHQVAPDPGAGERLSLVFRTQPEKR